MGPRTMLTTEAGHLEREEIPGREIMSVEFLVPAGKLRMIQSAQGLLQGLEAGKHFAQENPLFHIRI